jgi:hypothetical protein
MTDVLERHQQTLDLTDDNARAERIAYQQLANDYRHLTSELRATADRMLEYRDLPMALHHAEAMHAPEIRRALADLVERERDLAALLETWIEEDQAMLVVSKESLGLVARQRVSISHERRWQKPGCSFESRSPKCSKRL